MNRVDREIPESFTRRMLLAGSPVARFLVLLWVVLSSAAVQAQVVLKPTPRVVLGRSEAVQLEFFNPQGNAFALVTNAGSVASPRRQADGSWTALYTRPTQRFPQVAIVAVLGMDGKLLSWSSIPLYGEPDIHLSSEANAEITVRVGSELFGPVTTDSKGEASQKVQIPPGVGEVETLVSDAMGNTKTQPLSLAVAEFSRSLAVCTDDSLVVLAVKPSGEPLSGAVLSASASKGMSSPLQEIRPGEYAATYSLPASERRVESTVVLSVIGQGAELSTECRMTLPAVNAVEVVPVPEPEPVVVPHPRWHVEILAGYASTRESLQSQLVLFRLGVHPVDSMPRVSVEAEFGYCSDRVSRMFDGDTIVGSLRIVPIHLLLGYRVQMGKLRIGALLGGGVVVVEGRVESQAVGETSSVSSEFSYGAGSILGYPLGLGSLLLEAGYWRGALDGAVITGDVSGLRLLAGYSLDFG